jgi:hypothetical protein
MSATRCAVLQYWAHLVAVVGAACAAAHPLARPQLSHGQLGKQPAAASPATSTTRVGQHAARRGSKVEYSQGAGQPAAGKRHHKHIT